MIPAVTHRAEMIAAWCLPKKPRKKPPPPTLFLLFCSNTDFKDL